MSKETILKQSIKLFLEQNKILLKSTDFDDKNHLNNLLNDFIKHHYQCNNKHETFKIANNIIGNDIDNIKGEIKNIKYIDLIKKGNELNYLEIDEEVEINYRCCCGKKKLKHLYIVKYENGNSLLIGSSCIKKYNNEDLNLQLKEKSKKYEFKRLLREKINDENRKCYKCRCDKTCDFHIQRLKDYRKNQLKICNSKKCNSVVNIKFSKCFKCK